MQISPLQVTDTYNANRQATAARPGEGTNPMASAFESFHQTLQASEAAASARIEGRGDPHIFVQTLAQTELAVETAVTIRNKVVEAYQEILRMPV